MPERMFKRKLYDEMLRWKQEQNGNTALLIDGARRVGKTTLALEFAKNEYKSHIFIDFTDVAPEIRDLFNDISNLDDFLFNLQFRCGVQLVPRESVIIFDEVQNCPLARQAIRKLVSDGRYDYIETGSLISIKKNIQNIRIPNEETLVTLYPMDYEEFKWAFGDDTTISSLHKIFDYNIECGNVFCNFLRDFKYYMLIGGMPQVVSTYLNTNDIIATDDVKREIIELYAEDFRKIDDTGRATKIFYSIPEQLSSNAYRYHISSVIGQGDLDYGEKLIQDMEASQAVLVSHYMKDSNVGMPILDDRQYKMFVNDTGLFVTLASWDKKATDNEIYQKLQRDNLCADLDCVYKNAVAQMLKAAGNELYYHTWPTESGDENYEIDFLLLREDKLCPLEVNSSGSWSHTSLDAFYRKFPGRILRRYLIYAKDYRVYDDIYMIPVFLTMFL